MAWPEIAALAILGAWFVVSALAQIRAPLMQRLRAWDRFYLIPMWWFFAPFTLRGDVFLLYRTRDACGDISDWIELVVGGERRWFNFLWNPKRRERKALLDVNSALAGAALDSIGPEESQQIPLTLSVPYLTVLNYVSSIPHPPGISEIQFSLLMTDMSQSDEPEPVLVSMFHPLDSPC